MLFTSGKGIAEEWVKPKQLLRGRARPRAPEVCEFLRRLMHRARRPMFLILNGHAMHKAKLVSQCVEKYGGKLRLFFLRPYSPELNPDERSGETSSKTESGEAKP